MSTNLAADVEEFHRRLHQVLTITNWRAVVVVVIVAEPDLEKFATRVLNQTIQDQEIATEQVIQHFVNRDEVGLARLRAINRARDTLLSSMRMIWLVASSAADLRLLRKTAPDLMSSIDLLVELQPEIGDRTSWSACDTKLREMMKERHATLDFTGFLPAGVERRELPFAELYQPLVELGASTQRGLLVLGHAGTGKTTLLRHLAWTYARGEEDPLGIGSKTPLLLSLADYGYVREHDRLRTLVDFLPTWLADRGVEGAAALPERLGQMLLLLDGLNEMRSHEARRSVLAEVSQLLRDQRVGAVVVTGRSFLVDELHPDELALDVISPRPLQTQEIRRFLDKFVMLGGGSAAHARDLMARIERDDDLRALARTPLLLVFMILLEEFEGRLPDRKIELYYRMSEMIAPTAHSSITEYLVAVEISRDRTRWEELLANPFDPQRREIVLFCAGQLGVIEGKADQRAQLIRAVLAKIPRQRPCETRYPSLLIGLLEGASSLERAEIDELIEHLLELIETMASSQAGTHQIELELKSLLSQAESSIVERLSEPGSRADDHPSSSA